MLHGSNSLTAARPVAIVVAMRTELVGLREARAELRAEVKRVRFGIARGLTLVAKNAQRAVGQEMLRVFNRPNTYIRNAFRVEPAVAKNPGPLQAVVELRRDPQYTVHPLTPQVEGGTRRTKRFERALSASGAMQPGWYVVPTENALDGAGKVRKGLVQQVIAQAKAQLVAGYAKQLKLRKDTGRERRRKINAMGRAGGQFVFVPRRRGRLAPGIYLAEGRDFGAKVGYGRKGTLVPLFRYVSSVNYQPRLDFYGTVERIAGQQAATTISRSLEYAG